MVICTYFLNNTCRFGPKCHNEHVNVKLTLKTDAEAALKGNQWPMTCYGPFRDKPSIPNFIEDQTFEEARHLCYEAKATGNVQMVMNQFAQTVLDAKNKMNMLTNPTDDVVALVTNLYNSTCTPAPTSNANRNANPFGMSGGGATNSTTASSIFGGSAGVGNTANTSNLFGSATAASASNPFARSTGAFGMPQQNGMSQTTTANLFGNSQTPANAANPFGAAPNAAGAGSLFGGSSFANTGSSAFGGSTAGQTSSLFGGSSASGPFSQSTMGMGASPFAQTNQTTSVFGGGAQTQSNAVFGGAAAFGQPKPGLFGQASATLGQPTNPGSIFGQSVQNSGFGAPAAGAPAPATGTSFFGGATQTSSQSIFGQQNAPAQDNPFAAVAQSGTNIFGNAQSQQQQQQPPPPSFQSSTNMFGGGGGSANVFGNSNIQPAFGGGSNAFGAQMANQTTAATAPSLQQQQQSIFGTNSFSTPTPVAPIQNSPFGGASGGNVFQNQQPPQQTPTQSVFGSSVAPGIPDQMAAVQPNSNPFGAQPPQQYQQQPHQQQPQSDQQQSKTLYTPMDSLDPDEIEAFKSHTFDINKLPTKPPPMELCT